MNRQNTEHIIWVPEPVLWKLLEAAEHHMLMSKGKDLNPFQIYAKGGAKVNLLQSCYKHICSTSESESWREMQQQPNEQSYSPVQRRDGGKLGKEEEEQEVEIISSSTAMAALNLNFLIWRMTQVLLSWRRVHCHFTFIRAIRSAYRHLLHANHFIHPATKVACLGVYSAALLWKKGFLRYALLGKPLFKGGLQTIPGCNELHACTKESWF